MLFGPRHKASQPPPFPLNLLSDDPPCRELPELHESIILTAKFDLPASLTKKYVGGELQQDKNPHKIHQSAKRDSTIKQQKQRMQNRRKHSAQIVKESSID